MTQPIPPLPERPSIQAARRVDTLCDQFESAWKAAVSGAGRPTMATFLASESSENSDEVVSELLKVEIHYRQVLGERPHPDDYAELKISLDPKWFSDSPFDAMLTTPSVGRFEKTCSDTGANTSAEEKKLPRIFGNYELLEEVARGGMGVVYKARQAHLHRIVALKKILTAELASPAEVHRFQTEADAAAGLEHPNIVPIYEVGSLGGRHYYTMKLIEGGSLKEHALHLHGRYRDIARLLALVADAVQYAHSKAILHRDLKPANILLSSDHQSDPGVWNYEHVEAFVTDFGLAKRLECDTEQTRSDALLGTPAYMSPEQAVGGSRRIGTAADIYGIGAVLYELLTGHPPFTADSVLVMLTKVQHEEPVPPRQIVSSVPRDLETICLKCLQKDPHHRYSSASALADDLRRFICDRPITARPIGSVERFAKWVRRRPAIASLMALLLFVGMIGAGLVIWQWQAAVFHEREKDKALKGVQSSLLAMRRSDYFQRIARADLELNSYNADAAEGILDDCPEDLRDWEWHYLKGQCNTELFEISAHQADARVVCFSPDGMRLATGGYDGKVHLWDIVSRARLWTCHFPSQYVRSIMFSPDATQLYISGGDWLANTGAAGIWDVTTGQLKAKLEGVTGSIWRMALSPDGKMLAATQKQTVVLWNAENGKKIRSIDCHDSTLSVAFSPDGNHLAVGLRNGKILLHTSRFQSEGITWESDGDLEVRDLAFSPDGRQLISSSFVGQLKLWQVASRSARLLQFDSRNFSSVAFNPDGTNVAAGSINGPIYLWSTVGSSRGKPSLILNGHARETHHVTFSPGGHLLASAGWDGKIRIWDVAERPPMPAEPSALVDVAFSTDGNTFITAGQPPRVSKLHGHITLWDFASEKLLVNLAQRMYGYSSITLCGPGDLVAAGADHEIIVWNLKSRKELWKWTAHQANINRIIWLTDRGEIISAAQDGSVHVWPLSGSTPDQPRLALKLPSAATTLAGLESNLVCGCADGSIHVWDLNNGRLITHWLGHTGQVNALAWHASGSRLASGGEDHTVRLHSLSPKHGTRMLGLHLSPVTSLAFTPDGNRLMSAGIDGTLQLWDPETGQPVIAFRRQLSIPSALAFSPDGRSLLAVEGPRKSRTSFRLWKLPSDENVRTEQFQVAMALDIAAAVNRPSRTPPALPITPEQDWYLLLRRAWLHAEAGRWREADVESSKSIKLGAAYARVENEGYSTCWLRAALGNQQEYHALCNELLRHYEKSKGNRVPYVVAWLLTMRPDGLADHYKKSITLASHGTIVEPKAAWHWETLCMAYLRNQQWRDAISAANKVTELNSVGLGTELFAKAIALSHLGEKEAAYQSYQLGVTWMEKQKQAMLRTQSRWLDRRRFQIEAALLLGLPAPIDVPNWRK